MTHAIPVVSLIRRRYSCRTYTGAALGPDKRRPLEDFMALCQAGPLGSSLRFKLVAAGEDDPAALRGLTTYGIIRGAGGFILGAVGAAAQNMEDWGYVAEQLVLLATGLGLGTCWLGGTFQRSRFADRLALQHGELMPAVIAVGVPADRSGPVDWVLRQGAGSERRLPWQRLFFEGGFDTPLDRQAAAPYATPLEMVRLGPSASNRQPWRVVRAAGAWHFYLERTPGYRQFTQLGVGTIDLQRVDLGIALCHWELTAREMGLDGTWAARDPGPLPGAARRAVRDYVISWLPA